MNEAAKVEKNIAKTEGTTSENISLPPNEAAPTQSPKAEAINLAELTIYSITVGTVAGRTFVQHFTDSAKARVCYKELLHSEKKLVVLNNFSSVEATLPIPVAEVCIPKDKLEFVAFDEVDVHKQRLIKSLQERLGNKNTQKPAQQPGEIKL